MLVSAGAFNRFILESPHRLAMPIAVYPGLALTGGSVRDVVTNARAQFEAAAALHDRYRTPFVLSAMDLSAEAEAFGCTIQMAENEVPFVIGRLINTRGQAEELTIPQPGDKRTAVHLETVRRLNQLPEKQFVLGGSIGPFSLAARLVGVSEAMELTLGEPELMHAVLEKATQFLIAYARAFREVGANGLIMAEPAAGLLSPRGLGEFSSTYVRRIGEAAEAEDFQIVLHNCAARLIHLPAILNCGLRVFHFGAPMDLVKALGKVSTDLVLCGNLDPVSVMTQMPPQAIKSRVNSLLQTMGHYRNFVLSSGCDLPASTPLTNLDAFHAAAHIPSATGIAKKQPVFHNRRGDAA